jgi:hypothetical protein
VIVNMHGRTTIKKKKNLVVQQKVRQKLETTNMRWLRPELGSCITEITAIH